MKIEQIILMYVNLLDRFKLKTGRPEKLERAEYLKEIMYVLRTGIQWKNLRAELHWSTYYKKFTKWANQGVFKTCFEILNKILKKGKYLKRESYKDLYVDSSMIKNVRGCDKTGINHYDRGRKGSKSSLIITRDGIPINMKLFGSNIHDVTALRNQIDNLKIKIVGSRLIGDKGYGSRRLKNELNEKGIELIHPYRRNQREENTEEEKELLKGRNLVENVFSWIQNRRRIRMRHEVKSIYYIELYHLCLIDLIMNRIDL